jgi:hypothetical protein
MSRRKGERREETWACTRALRAGRARSSADRTAAATAAAGRGSRPYKSRATQALRECVIISRPEPTDARGGFESLVLARDVGIRLDGVEVEAPEMELREAACAAQRCVRLARREELAVEGPWPPRVGVHLFRGDRLRRDLTRVSSVIGYRLGDRPAGSI